MPESKICMLVTKPDWQLQLVFIERLNIIHILYTYYVFPLSFDGKHEEKHKTMYNNGTQSTYLTEI